MIAGEDFDAALYLMSARPPADPAQEAVDDVKAYAKLQARAALAGFELVRMPGGDYVVGRWGMVRALPTVADVEAFLSRVGALGA